ncbi:MAG: 8-oxo-dGTP diphosphatase MutT [Myxococcota bacterium]
MSERAVLVAAAVVRQAGRILLTKRPAKTHLGGLWEFPGGKVEASEDPRSAVVRELKEECGVLVRAGAILETVFHRYETKSVLLLFYECELIEGEVQNLGVSEHVWVRPAELSDYEFPPADAPLIALLQSAG